jgi:NADPH-dependent glutamate synthase beta subunit-like oxidoreductase
MRNLQKHLPRRGNKGTVTMPRLTIDNHQIEVPDGTTILDAASKLGIEIPTMCFLKDYDHSTSCMICVVKLSKSGKLTPACSAPAEEGMRIETDCDQVRQARTTALELLLSDHVGDCMGPCHVTCPARMNIPLMIRQIAAGKLAEAIVTVKNDIALPAVLGRICPKPCEKPCRRAKFDQPVSICLLKRYVADVDLFSAQPYLTVCGPKKDKRVAIIGAGPAGLAAGYYLRQKGYDCTIYDENEKPGGALRYAVPQDELDRSVLDAEIALIEKLGVEFVLNKKIGNDISLQELQKQFDAVFIATGQIKEGDTDKLGLEMASKGIKIDSDTYQTSIEGVFAGGDAVRSRRIAVRAVADGKEASVSIDQYLCGTTVTGPQKPFNSRIGRLLDGEIEKFMANSSNEQRISPSQQGAGFSDEQAKAEAQRCLHCDCRKADNCSLRDYSQQYGARQSKYKANRRKLEQYDQHDEIIYEPGKCIDCGLCVKITAEQKEPLGLTFISRGFDVRVAVPFDRSIAEGLKQTAKKCIKACPTGAMAIRD